jgi:hypothetical protein
MDACFGSNSAVKVPPWPLSTSATNSSPYRKGAGNLRMMVVIFGLVVDDKDAARTALKDAGVTTLDGSFLDFRDPWGNRIEIVAYDNIQFTKAQNVLRGMGLEQLTKNEKAMQELVKKGMA